MSSDHLNWIVDGKGAHDPGTFESERLAGALTDAAEQRDTVVGSVRRAYERRNRGECTDLSVNLNRWRLETGPDERVRAIADGQQSRRDAVFVDPSLDVWVPEMLIRVKRRRRVVLGLVVWVGDPARRPPLREWSMI
jgi:hypothetical protein